LHDKRPSSLPLRGIEDRHLLFTRLSRRRYRYHLHLLGKETLVARGRVMKQIAMALFAGVATASVAATALAHEGPMPRGIRHLDHVFLIMMENHGYAEIINNPYMPFTNQL